MTSNIEQDMMDVLAKEIQEEIDWGIMLELMKATGWTHVVMQWSNRMDSGHAHEIKEWCKANCVKNYKGRGADWLFESKEEAVMFKLRWS